MDSNKITVTDYRLKEALRKANEKSMNVTSQQLQENTKNNIIIREGKILRYYYNNTALVRTTDNKEVTCSVLNLYSDENSLVACTPIGQEKDNYILPYESLTCLILSYNNKHYLISYLNTNNKVDSANNGEILLKMGDNKISLTDERLNIISEHFFINGLPYDEININTEPDPDPDPDLDKYYPIGSIYMNINNINPNIVLGGTWEKLENAFLLGSGEKESGETGGSADAVVVKHTHTQNAHSHKPSKDSYFLEATGNVAANMTDRQWPSQSSTEHYHSVYIPTDAGTVTIDESTSTATATAVNQETGEDGTGKNLPPYLTVNMWLRIA